MHKHTHTQFTHTHTHNLHTHTHTHTHTRAQFAHIIYTHKLHTHTRTHRIFTHNLYTHTHTHNHHHHHTHTPPPPTNTTTATTATTARWKLSSFRLVQVIVKERIRSDRDVCYWSSTNGKHHVRCNVATVSMTVLSCTTYMSPCVHRTGTSVERHIDLHVVQKHACSFCSCVFRTCLWWTYRDTE